MKSIPTISIGIPAHNEGKTIARFLQAILAQKQSSFNLEKTYIFLDGCTDDTKEKAEEAVIQNDQNQNIVIVDDGKRVGKSARLNQFFTLCSSDIAIVFDADISFSSSDCIEKLLKPMLEKTNAQSARMLVSGKALPFAPHGAAQSTAYAGVMVWEIAKKIARSHVYDCEGTVRAFGRKVYSHLRFPETSADDAFSFLFCMKHGYVFAHASDAVVYFKLPASFSDYFKQMRRFVKSFGIQADVFDEEFAGKYYTIDGKIKLQALARNLIHDPVWTVFYFTFAIYVRVYGFFDRQKETGLWNIAVSTKTN